MLDLIIMGEHPSISSIGLVVVKEDFTGKLPDLEEVSLKRFVNLYSKDGTLLSEHTLSIEPGWAVDLKKKTCIKEVHLREKDIVIPFEKWYSFLKFVHGLAFVHKEVKQETLENVLLSLYKERNLVNTIMLRWATCNEYVCE